MTFNTPQFEVLEWTQEIGPSLKKCLFGIAYPGFHLVGQSVGIIYFFNIYYNLHMDGNGKKKKKIIISDLKKKKLSSSKTGESVGNAKQTIFYFWPCPVTLQRLNKHFSDLTD